MPPRLPIVEAQRRVAEIMSRPPMLGPSIDPCSCGAGRHEHAGEAMLGRCVRTACKRYRRDLVDVLVQRAIEGHRNTLGDDLRKQDAENQAERLARGSAGDVKVSASDHSTCRRAVQYRERPPEDFYASRTDKRAAYMGQLIHDSVAALRQRLYPWRQFEQAVHIDGIGESRFDEYDPVMGALDDLKCTTPDTPVLMADGSERRADAVRVGEHVVAWDAANDRLAAARVTFSANNGVRPVVTLRVAGGRVLTVTHDHPILLAREQGGRRTYAWTLARDVKAGDRVRLALGWQGCGSPYERPALDGPACQHEGSAPHSTRTGGRYCSAHYGQAPAFPDAHRPLTDSDAYLLGALVGDGGLTGWMDGRDHPLTYSCADSDLLAAVEKALSAFDARLQHAGGCNYRVHFENSTLRARAFRSWLLRHDMLHGAYDKRVPREVMAGSTEVRAAFAAGLLDTDGTVVERGSVTWASVSGGLLRDMQMLLAHLGVAATLAEIRGTYNGLPHRSHSLTVKRATDVSVLAATLLLSVARKRDRLAVLATRSEYRHGHSDLARVVAVEDAGQADTWALTVEGLHTHVTSGFVTHNTAGDWKWSLLTEDGPPESEWKQAFTYALSKHREGAFVRVVRIVYVQRADGRDSTFERPWNVEYAERAVDDLITLATQIELGIEQPRDEPGPALSPICARYCFARDYCWNVPAAERHGRTPESWTLLGSDPADDDIYGVLTQYIEARSSKGEAEKAQKAAGALLGGLEQREYGPVGEELRFGRDKPRMTVDEEAYERVVLEWAKWPDGVRPPLKSVEKPKRPGEQGSLRIGPVPKAEREKRVRALKALEKAQKHAAEVAVMGEVDGPYPAIEETP